MTYLDASMQALIRWERQVPWMYRDSSQAGHVTAATGEMLPTAASAVIMPFQTSAGAPATATQIRLEYARVLGLPRAHLADFYRNAQSPTLPVAYMDSLLARRQAGFEAQLRLIFPGVYDGLPDPAKVALIDMAFNLGAHGLADYSHLVAAVKAGDFRAASANCSRGGIGPDRNAWTAAEFASA